MSQALSTRGRFVWNDLMAKDAARARAFYTELMGWRVEEHDMGAAGKYAMLWNGTRGLGGIVPLQGAPDNVASHWVNYVSVDDVDASCKQAPELGGKVCVPAFDIPGVGRTALLEDPSGAIIHAFRATDAAMSAEKERPAVGDFCWYELMTAKVEESKAFYAGIFGWTWDKRPGDDAYWIAKDGDRQRCGLLLIRPGVPHSHWLSYLAVEDHAASAERAVSLGGKKLGPAVAIPGIGTFSPVKDAVGAPIALFQSA